MKITSIVVPDACIPLLLEQRTHYLNNPAVEYSAELNETYLEICDYLPNDSRILDIGCGMAGIDVLLGKHYGNGAKITISDKQGVSKVINCGFHENADEFSNYHDFDAALKLLESNGISNVECVDLNHQPFPCSEFDVVISLLSWGFHYPITTYNPKVSRGGVIIADIRNGTNGDELLGKYGKVKKISERKKHHRVLVQC
jgi:SAM-dependent methyltransferase